MKAPNTGTGYSVEGFGQVLVKMGPSPEEPYVWFEYWDSGPEYEKLHIEEWKERVR